jgi:hypothetical protein
MNKTNQLHPGDVIQRGDKIATIYETGRTMIDRNACHTSAQLKESVLRDVSNHTLGRVILPGDLINAVYYRP